MFENSAVLYFALTIVPPLVAAIAITLIPWKRALDAALTSILACALSFAGAILLFISPTEMAHLEGCEWIGLDGFYVSFGAMTDGLARMMLMVVTGVGLMIHIFAYGYIKEDKGASRFFAKLSLFMFSMLGIVFSDNLVMLFIFWELVGLSSYLLIGFWFEKPSAAAASKKAFIANRIGDFGFLLGILGVWAAFGTLSIPELADKIAAGGVAIPSAMALIGLGLFMGCVGKSAQLPLHVWLPDAMEGPTPVSALIHAATMVAAGVYMLCRLIFIIELSPEVMTFIALIGGTTALFAAVIAIQQDDIKRILAYSTLSQLGYMVLAVGIAAPAAGMFHLTTHAFFKALLFLCAGSVIHALHHEQNIWKMGGLFGKMKVTSIAFLIGSLALAGFPFLFSGFWSKEAILAEVLYFGTHPEKYGISQVFGYYLIFAAFGTAVLTAFYMTRCVLVAFFGKERSEAVSHAHEGPWYMTGPLVVLSVLSVIGGFTFIGISGFINGYFEAKAHEGDPTALIVTSIVIFIVGVAVGWVLYRGKDEDPLNIQVLREKFYSDEIYDAAVVGVQQKTADFFYGIDRYLVGMGLVRGSSVVLYGAGEVLRLFQGGSIQAYVMLFIIGVVLLSAALIGGWIL